MRKIIIYIQLFVIICFYIFIERNVEDESNYELMLQSRNRMEEIFKIAIEEKNKRGIFIDKKLDINNSGLIGEEFTGITTTLGDLDSKRASTNPNYAAFFIKYFKTLNLSKGDEVAVNMSSSFPSLNLALIVALDLMELEGVIINSIGSSMYGANNEKLTFLELQDILKKKDKIKNNVVAYSYGGDDDNGSNFNERVRENIENRIKKLDLELINEKEFKKNIKRRIGIYEQNRDVKCYINIGGNLVHGELEKYFKKKEIHVLSMINIKEISLKYRIGIKKEKEDSKIYFGQSKKLYSLIISFFVLFNLTYVIIMKNIVRKTLLRK